MERERKGGSLIPPLSPSLEPRARLFSPLPVFLWHKETFAEKEKAIELH